MKELSLFILLSAIITGTAFGQVDTTSYPDERREIRELLKKPNALKDCADFIAVGPRGDISFSNAQWQEVQKKQKLIFRSARVVPNTEFIRIYDGRMAVLNFLLDVKLTVDGKDLDIMVRRLEVYHKKPTGWCRVAGQGTEVDQKMFPVN